MAGKTWGQGPMTKKGNFYSKKRKKVKRNETWFGKPFKQGKDWYVNYNIKSGKTGFIDTYIYKCIDKLD
jgi:hypothetical protein